MILHTQPGSVPGQLFRESEETGAAARADPDEAPEVREESPVRAAGLADDLPTPATVVLPAQDLGPADSIPESSRLGSRRLVHSVPGR